MLRRVGVGCTALGHVSAGRTALGRLSMGCIALGRVGMGCVGLGLLGYRPPRAGRPLAARCAPLPPAGPAQFGAPPAALVTVAAVAVTRFVLTRQIRHAVLLARLLREPTVKVVELITIGGTSRAT